MKGTLIPTTARKRSGRRSAAFHAVIVKHCHDEPEYQDWRHRFEALAGLKERKDSEAIRAADANVTKWNRRFGLAYAAATVAFFLSLVLVLVCLTCLPA